MPDFMQIFSGTRPAKNKCQPALDRGQFFPERSGLLVAAPYCTGKQNEKENALLEHGQLEALPGTSTRCLGSDALGSESSDSWTVLG